MRLLLVSATVPECGKTFDWLDAERPESVDRLVSGVGQLPAAWQIQRQVGLHRPDLIVQAGIGGSSDPGDIGRVFTIDSEMLADLGAEDPSGFRSLFEMQLADPEAFPFVHGRLPNPYERLLAASGLPRRPGVTVNTLRSRPENGAGSEQKQAPVVESMEGAALHYVALQQHIPFLQVRAISNRTGERDKSRWRLAGSVENLNLTLIPLIQNLLAKNETDFRL